MKKKIKVGVWFDNAIYNYQLNSPKYNDGRTSQYNILKKKLSIQNINLEIIDDKNLYVYDIILFIGYPLQNKQSKFIKKKNKVFFLILNECEVISGLNYEKTNFKPFDEIFTVTNQKIKNVKFTKLLDCSYNYKKINSEKKNLFCIVFSNKRSSSVNENYTERLKIINWFSQNKHYEADLFGNKWDRLPFPTDHKFLKYFNSKYLDFIFKFFFKPPKIWKGIASDKYITISQYKFTLAFENAINYPGYITEKILDCFFCKTVPVYYGANDIEKFIPNNCFIDYRNFKNPKKLYTYISSLSDEDYNNYLLNAQKFLDSDKFIPFDHNSYANHFIKAIKKYF